MVVDGIYPGMARKFVGSVLALAAVWVGMASVAGAQAATATPQLDLTKLAGRYYEIARLPSKTERKCVSDPILLYALGDKPGRFQVVASCRQKDEFTDVHILDGRRQKKQDVDGRLKLGSFWPLLSKYWVLDVGPDSEWLLVGTPNHKKLWIYAKSATMPLETLADVKTKAAAQGYKVDSLVSSPQSGMVHAAE